MATDDAPQGEPLSEETLREYRVIADDLARTNLWGQHTPLSSADRANGAAAIRALLAEVFRLRTENAALRAELAELAQAAELGAAGAFVAGMRVKGEG